MKPPSKKALERERQQKEGEEYKRLVLKTWQRHDQEDRRKVVDLKTTVQINARHRL